MVKKTKIEWTQMTWNPVTGCTKVSTGCKHCYAEAMAERLRQMGSPRYKNGFKLTLHEDLIDLPTMWKRPRIIFVNSMSDLFHEDVPIEFIQRIFETMRKCPHHQFQILTKRAERLLSVCDQLEWCENIWMGVSIENQRYAYRSTLLQQVPAYIRFLSIEPLVGRIERLPLENIHWVIVGGESGPNARYLDPEWVEEIFYQCRAANVPFFFKQWGGIHKHKAGRELFGRTFDEMPVAFAARQNLFHWDEDEDMPEPSQKRRATLSAVPSSVLQVK